MWATLYVPCEAWILPRYMRVYRKQIIIKMNKLNTSHRDLVASKQWCAGMIETLHMRKPLTDQAQALPLEHC